MKLIKILLPIKFILILALFFISPCEAKWWIFGVSEDEVTIKFLYINNISYDELGPKITIYRETLEDGHIIVRGKATVRTGRIASVRISINNKESWEKAKLSREGDFEFRFRPELNKTYVMFIEIMDTRGKTNDIEATRKEITVSERNITAMVKEVLEGMAEAYRREDAGKFMSYVAEDFAGDAVNLDRAIRKDFSLFDNIDLRFTINNVASGSKGIVVSINFSRSLVSSRTGKLLSDKGITEFVFKLGERGLKVYSMKFPLIFGLSDASNVATGVVQSPSNEPTIVVDARGNVVKEPFDRALKTAKEEEVASSSILSGTVTLYTSAEIGPGPWNCESFKLADEDKFSESCHHNPTQGDFLFARMFTGSNSVGVILFKNGVKWKSIPGTSIDSIDEVPDQSTYNTTRHHQIYSLHLIALYLPEGNYAVIEIVNHNFSYPLPNPDTTTRYVSLRYKYQTNRTRKFK